MFRKWGFLGKNNEKYKGKIWNIHRLPTVIVLYVVLSMWLQTRSLNYVCVCVFAYFLSYNISLSRGRISNKFSKKLPWQIRIIQTAAVRNSEMRSQRWGRVTTETSQLNGGEIGPSFRHSKRAEGGEKKKKSVEAATARVHVHISASARGSGSQSVLKTKLVSPSAGQMEDVLCVSSRRLIESWPAVLILKCLCASPVHRFCSTRLRGPSSSSCTLSLKSKWIRSLKGSEIYWQEMEYIYIYI